jgi:hypothetical protein
MQVIKNSIVAFCLLVILLSVHSCAEVFEKSLDNEKIVLIAPADSIIVNDSAEVFYWQPVEASTGYELQIVSPKFDSLANLVMDTTILSNTFPLVLDSGQYQWRVRAFNASSTTSFTSARTFTIH